MISTAVTFLGSATACNSGVHSQVSSIYNMLCSIRGVQRQRTAYIQKFTEQQETKKKILSIKVKEECFSENVKYIDVRIERVRSGYIHHQVPCAEGKNQGNFEEGGLAWWTRAHWLAKKTCRCSHIASSTPQKLTLCNRRHGCRTELPTEGVHRQVILGYQKGLSISM